MKVLFLTTNRIVDLKTRGIYSDLINMFIEENHEVTIVSSNEKKYNIKTNYKSFDKYKHLQIQTGNLQKINPLKKVYNLSRLNKIYIKNIKKHVKDIKEYDLIIYNTPPIMLNKTIKYIKNKSKAKTFLLLKDIFPQNAVDLNMFRKNGLIYKYYRKKEKCLYNISDYIGCMSKENVSYLKRNNELKNKVIDIVPNSINIVNDNFTSDIENKKNEYKIPLNKNIFLYGGNLGKPQGIDFLIRVLKLNELNNDNFIVIVGSGTEYNKLEKTFEEMNFKNSLLINQLPKEEYENLVTIVDVGLILLDHRFTIPNFPSRLLSYLNAKKPVLAATDKNTDIKDVIKEGKFGYWCESIDEYKFIELMNNFKDKNKKEEMGQNAYKYLKENYDVKDAYKKIMTMIGE